MANKTYCDFCGKEIGDKDDIDGKLIITSGKINPESLKKQPIEPMRLPEVDRFDLCKKCCQKILKTIKKT